MSDETMFEHAGGADSIHQLGDAFTDSMDGALTLGLACSTALT